VIVTPLSFRNCASSSSDKSATKANRGRYAGKIAQSIQPLRPALESDGGYSSRESQTQTRDNQNDIRDHHKLAATTCTGSDDQPCLHDRDVNTTRSGV
jgi:hypothetical protein